MIYISSKSSVVAEMPRNHHTVDRGVHPFNATMTVLKRQCKTFLFNKYFSRAIYLNYVRYARSTFAYATSLVTF